MFAENRTFALLTIMLYVSPYLDLQTVFCLLFTPRFCLIILCRVVYFILLNMAVNLNVFDDVCQAATSEIASELDQNNLPDILFQSFSDNVKPCEVFKLDAKAFDIDNRTSHFFLHLNISSLQSHFEELYEFLCNFSSHPTIIFLSETRININPYINTDIPGYTFIHSPSPTKAGGVGAYISNILNFTIKDNLSLNVTGCEDLRINVEFPSRKISYAFAVIYRHPCNNYNAFFEALDQNMQSLNRKGSKVVILGDVNIDLSSDLTRSPLSDYFLLLQSNAFASLTTKPTRVTNTSSTVIDHILINDSDSSISSGVLTYSISDHYPIFCTISNPLFKTPKKNQNLYTYRKIDSVNSDDFRNDLMSILLPICNNFKKSTEATNMSESVFDEHFNELMNALSKIINKHAPIQKASRKQRRFLQKPWLTKGLLISIKNKQKLNGTHLLCGTNSEKLFYKKYANKLTRVKKCIMRTQ